MTLVFSLTLSIAFVLVCMAVPWRTPNISTWKMLVVFAVSLILWVSGAALSLAWYPWTSVVDIAIAVSGGVLLGRAIPARFWPFFVACAILSLLDSAQVLLSTYATPIPHNATMRAEELYSNVYFRVPWGKYSIGPFDLLVVTMIAAYWRRRGARFIEAFLGVAGAFGLAYGILFAHPIVLALIPFLTLGWLATTIWSRARRKALTRRAIDCGKHKVRASLRE